MQNIYYFGNELPGSIELVTISYDKVVVPNVCSVDLLRFANEITCLKNIIIPFCI